MRTLHRRTGGRFLWGLRVALLLTALGLILYWFWWQPLREPAPPLRIEFRP
ncbi:MAG: hypothetical protein ABDI19_03375 [Armatimonadota bacterium]